MPSITLEKRAVLSVAGEGARQFLQGLVTCDMAAVTPGRPGFGALLTPQGKIITDFFAHEVSNGDGAQFLIDCPAPLAADLLKRLKMYRLRAKLALDEVSGQWVSGTSWDGLAPPAGAVAGPDPRHTMMGLRWLAPAPMTLLSDIAAYTALRVACGVPEGGTDFAYGETFPHEANMDLLHGVDFRKGCYVGQEVVSRVEHRGTARKRIVQVQYETAPPPAGTPVMMGEIEIGTSGSTSGLDGIALLRTDRLQEASTSGIPVTAAGIALAAVAA